MPLRTAGDRFRSVYKTTTGKQVRGEMSAVETDTGVTDFTLPRRIFKVSPRAVISVGEIIVTPTGRKYLLCDNGESERETVLYKTFKLVELDRQVGVSRTTTVTDPLTGLPKATTTTAIETIHCVFEFLGQESTNLKVNRDSFRVVTNFALQNGDTLTGGYIVRNAETLLGVCVATVSR